jgi:Zn-dependent metalloprotease/uncharacterized protein YjdB/fibronectin type 3 domain-containing protein
MGKKLISIFLSLALISSVTVPVSAKETEKVKGLNKVQAIQKLKNLSDGNLKLSEKDGQIFLSGKLTSKQSPGEKSAVKFLDENKFLFGINSTTEDLKAVDVKKDETGHTFVKFVQVIKGIKVDGSLINVHFDKNGTIVSVNGKLEKNKSITTLGNKSVSESEAVEIAKKQHTYKSLRNTPKAEKIILNKDNKNYEVYKVNISYMEPAIANYDVYVEAHSGKVIQTESNIRYDGAVTGSGTDVKGTTRTLNLYQSGTSYQMKDITKSATSDIVTYSLNHGTSPSNGALVSNSTKYFTTVDHRASVSAHYNAGKVIDFYKRLFNRNSLDNNGMVIKSYTHYGNSYNNAFWSGSEMVYGDGDGRTFTYLSGDLDVVGHEMTHGVIDNTADLYYHNQSGALNESMADVFGVLISTYDKYSVASGKSWTFNTADWVVGDDIYTPGKTGDALRSLSNPTLYDQPDHMNDYESSSDDEDGDWGGVHTNSGITNKAAYLIAKSIGMEKTARIYYKALVNYMSYYTNFEGAKDCLVQAAADLYGTNSTVVAAVANSFAAVGIGQAWVNDPYDPNDTMQTAYSINFGTTYQSYISRNTDVDYYKLNVNNAGSINIALSNLPYDYDLIVYDSYGYTIGSSSRGGTQSESINFSASAGSGYYIEVYTYSSYNFSTTQKYSLIATRAVTGVSLSRTTADLEPGDTVTLAAAVTPTDASNKNITWSSDDTSVATVDTKGKVIAVRDGTATITVTTADGGYTAECYVTVQSVPVSGISLDRTTAELSVGQSINLTATVSPEDATNKNVTWISSDTSVATVNNAGKLTAVGEGEAAITVTTADGGYAAECSVIAHWMPTTGVSLNKTETGLKIGETLGLIASMEPIDASNRNVTWSSSDNSVATVDNKGIVTPTGKGTTTITVTTEEGGYTASCSVTVTKPVKEVILDKTTAGLKVGESTNLTATVSPTDASNIEISWSSSNNSIAAVDDTGRVTATGLGTARITVTAADGGLTANCDIIVFEDPDAPASLQAVSAGYNSIKVSWGAVTGASGYEIYRATSSSGTYTKVGDSATSSCTDTGLNIETNYYYKVKAYRTVWSTKHYSDYSSVTSAKPVLPVPASPAAVSTGYNSIKISWSAVSGASGYEIHRATTSNGSYSKVGESATASFTNTGLATAATYYYKIKSYRTVGSTRIYGSYSSIVSAKPIPSTPISVKAASASYTSNNITWGAVSGASGYQVYRATSSTGSYIYLSTTASLTYINIGLTTGTTYYYKIRAYRTVGTTKVYSLDSAVVSARPIPATPSSPKAASASHNSIMTSWSIVKEANGYEVYRATSSTGTYSLVGATTALSYTHTGLTTGIAYFYKVRSYKTVGTTKVYGDFSAAVSARPIPAVPTSPKALSASYNSIKLTWSAAGGASGYEVYRSTSSTGAYTYIASAISTSYINTGLTTNTTYYYKIRSYNTAGTSKLYGSFSSAVSAKPIPSVPTSVKATSSSYNSINISWITVSGASGYEVYRATSSTGPYSKISTTSALSFKNTSLTTGKAYYYEVRSYRTVGSTKVYSSYSTVVTTKPVPSVPASARAGLSAYNSIKISWNAVSGASGYQIYRSTSSTGTYTWLTTTTSTSYTNKALPTNKIYYYKIRAYRTVGSTRLYGSYSPVVSAVTRSPYSPYFSTQSPAQTNSYTSYVGFYLTNYGLTTLRVYSSGSYLSDDDFSSYDRDLQMVHPSTYADISWIEFPSGSSGWVWFRVKGNPTWYDARSTIYFDFTYDGFWYRASASNYYNDKYWRK